MSWPPQFGRGGSGAITLGPCRMSVGQVADDPAEELDLRLARRGDPDAFTRLVARYQRPIARLLWKFCRDRDEHEELLQQVFIDAWVALPTFRGQGRFENWLRKLAVRAGVDSWRRRKRERVEFTDAIDEVADAAMAADDATDAVAAADLVHRLLARLSDRDRAVLTLLYLEGCDTDEAAALLGWSRSMVKVQAHRARRRLSKMMAGEG